MLKLTSVILCSIKVGNGDALLLLYRPLEVIQVGLVAAFDFCNFSLLLLELPHDLLVFLFQGRDDGRCRLLGFFQGSGILLNRLEKE